MSAASLRRRRRRFTTPSSRSWPRQAGGRRNCLAPGSRHLLRHGQLGLRFHLDRDAAQPADVSGRRAHDHGRARAHAAMPFIRVPDATEGDIQKATDIGALGIIIPMVDTVEKVQNAIKFAKYPPAGRRSQGGGQYGALWGGDYRRDRQRQHHDRRDDREPRRRGDRRARSPRCRESTSSSSPAPT